MRSIWAFFIASLWSGVAAAADFDQVLTFDIPSETRFEAPPTPRSLGALCKTTPTANWSTDTDASPSTCAPGYVAAETVKYVSNDLTKDVTVAYKATTLPASASISSVKVRVTPCAVGNYGAATCTTSHTARTVTLTLDGTPQAYIDTDADDFTATPGVVMLKAEYEVQLVPTTSAQSGATITYTYTHF